MKFSILVFLFISLITAQITPQNEELIEKRDPKVRFLGNEKTDKGLKKVGKLGLYGLAAYGLYDGAKIINSRVGLFGDKHTTLTPSVTSSISTSSFNTQPTTLIVTAST